MDANLLPFLKFMLLITSLMRRCSENLFQGQINNSNLLLPLDLNNRPQQSQFPGRVQTADIPSKIVRGGHGEEKLRSLASRGDGCGPRPPDGNDAETSESVALVSWTVVEEEIAAEFGTTRYVKGVEEVEAAENELEVLV